MNGAPEYNVTGQDFADRRHFRYAGPPLIDIHAHVTLTKPLASPSDKPTDGGPLASEPPPNLDQADIMFEVAREFNVGRIISICGPEDIPPLRERFGDRVGFSGSISKKLVDPDDVAYELLDRYLKLGIDRK